MAQFRSRSPGATELICVLCDEVIQVERSPCQNPRCQGDVLAEGVCLTCARSQEDCLEVDSGFVDDTLAPDKYIYEFTFRRGSVGLGGTTISDQRCAIDDGHAREHAAFAMRAPHLRTWDTVTIRHLRPGFPLRDREPRRVLGCWRRSDNDLVWFDGVAADSWNPDD